MRYYELTIKTKEANVLLEKVKNYLPNPPIREQEKPDLLTLEFYAEPEKIAELEKKLKADSLRYMILTKKTLKEVALSHQPPSVKTKVKTKVELKEIEKKLEEILKD